MKTISEGMRQHLAQAVLKLTTCWKITRKDGTSFYFTDHDQDLVANGGETYRADTGFSRSAGAGKSDMSVDNSDVQGLLSASQIDPNDIRAGLFENAEIWIFLVYHEAPEDVRATIASGVHDVYFTAASKRIRLASPVGNWVGHGFEIGDTITITRETASENIGDFTIASFVTDAGSYDTAVVSETLVDENGTDFTIDTSKNGDGMGKIKIRRGHIGEVEIKGNLYDAEIRGMTQVLTVPLGRVTTSLCPVDLFSTECGLDYLSFKVSTTVYAVTDNRVFTVADGQLTEATGYYDGGVVKWTAGSANAGLTMEIEAWDVDTDTITLFMPMPFAIDPNDPFDIIPGCHKRFDEDCKTKFDNTVNHRGFPHIPGVDKLLETPDARTA